MLKLPRLVRQVDNISRFFISTTYSFLKYHELHLSCDQIYFGFVNRQTAINQSSYTHFLNDVIDTFLELHSICFIL